MKLENPRPLRAIEIAPDVWVDGDQVVSMQFESDGTTITLVNGRKIYVAGMRPIEIINILNKPWGPNGLGFDGGDPRKLGDSLPDNQ